MNINEANRLREPGDTERMVENRRRLMELVSRDRQYGIWMGIFSEAKEEYTLYLEQQSPEVQNILCAALGSCEILHERLIDVICMNVDLQDPGNRKRGRLQRKQKRLIFENFCRRGKTKMI